MSGDQGQGEKPKFEAKVQPYQEHFKAEIEAEYAEIANMKDENNEPLSKARVKYLQTGVQKKYKKMFQDMNAPQKKQEPQQAANQVFEPLVEDASLPKAERILLQKENVEKSVGKRVEIQAWCHHVRTQSKKLVFLDLRDGHGFIQAVLGGPQLKCKESQDLIREAAVMVRGVISKTDKAPTGFEIAVDYWELIGTSNTDFESVMPQGAGPEQRAKYKHLVHRGTRGAAIVKLKGHILALFREFFQSKDWTEVVPPTIVNTSCEGGSTLFKLDYYGEEAYMTQSSQLYLESVIHACGDVYCVLPSYRAEKSNTRRHVAEFTHLETEHAFIKFEDLIQHIEDMVCYVTENLYERHKDLLLSVTDKPIHGLKKPFKRMTYLDAIAWLNERNVLNDEGKPFQFGDDIAETQERKMIDEIGEPVFLTKFPAELKSFYMARCQDDDRLTESTDLLVPTVGEIVGGSMRLWRMQETIDGYNRGGVPLENYYWYTDVRKYGACPHGGMGLGVDRFACWLLGLYNIREAILYPRAYGQLMP